MGTGAWAVVGFSAVFVTAFAFSAWQTGISRIGPTGSWSTCTSSRSHRVASVTIFYGEVLGIEKIVGGWLSS